MAEDDGWKGSITQGVLDLVWVLFGGIGLGIGASVGIGLMIAVFVWLGVVVR